MKKLLSMVLVLTLILSMGALAFAVERDLGAEDDWSPIRIKKELTVNGGVNPEEVFNFTIGSGAGERDEVAIDAPDFDPNTFTITVEADELTGFADIDLPEFTQVGVYTYPISEDLGNTAGFGYDDGEYNLVVTVINDPDGDGFLRVLTLADGNDVKTDAFQNTFSAGDLTIKKEVTGNYADPNDEFEVTVTLTAQEDFVLNAEEILAEGADSANLDSDGNYVIVYTVKDGSEYTVENIPYNVNYTVEETDSGEYEVKYFSGEDELDNAEGEFDAELIEITIVNERSTVIETGINLDNAPYILILAGVAVGLVGFTMKRRLSNDK